MELLNGVAALFAGLWSSETRGLKDGVEDFIALCEKDAARLPFLGDVLSGELFVGVKLGWTGGFVPSKGAIALALGVPKWPFFGEDLRGDVSPGVKFG